MSQNIFAVKPGILASGAMASWSGTLGTQIGSGFKPTGVHMKLLANPLPLTLTFRGY
jgi:hypothetical protein